MRAEQFDDVSFAQTFVLQPLIFLGGVFYSASLLPEPFQTLTHFDPVYYMISLVRYGFLGYTEVNIALSLAVLTAATLALFAVNLRMFSRGYSPPRMRRVAARSGDRWLCSRRLPAASDAVEPAALATHRARRRAERSTPTAPRRGAGDPGAEAVRGPEPRPRWWRCCRRATGRRPRPRRPPTARSCRPACSRRTRASGARWITSRRSRPSSGAWRSLWAAASAPSTTPRCSWAPSGLGVAGVRARWCRPSGSGGGGCTPAWTSPLPRAR
ncbi:MAG: ABC transporter permease [Thermoleophilaceae bacterium]